MPHELPKAYDPAAIEEHWAEYWVRENLFHASALDESALAQHFTILLPPPNVTGRLHIGHMFEQTEMDILVRWRRMRGERTLWVPGTDHAGIATQLMVERQLAEEKTSRQQLGREAFLERVWKWREQYGGAILDQMKRLGASVDWSREYFTMDAGLSRAVREAFVRLHEQGLIYRGSYIVNWCPRCQTAVSDLEVMHEEQQGKLYTIPYAIVGSNDFLLVATTRPETLFGDTAIAVHPVDERYRHLQGRSVRVPFLGREIPVIADPWVSPEFGTGAVKITPAHDPNDYAMGQRHKLAAIDIMDETAHLNEVAGAFARLDRYEARKRIVAELEGQPGFSTRDHANSIGKCDRCKTVVEPRLSTQWFVRIQPLADTAIAAVEQGHIRFTPEQYGKTYFEWMRNIHDWCISRQLWWGHRIPAWHCAACNETTVASETPQVCAHCKSAAIMQETDVLDTWFSSGLLPMSVFGWPNAVPDAKSDLAAFYPTELLVTGFDILFFWVARMIMLGCHFMLDVSMPDGSRRTLKDAVPFREVYIHALVRDADKQKMSKTKGNVLDPIEIVHRYGTDAVRFTLAAMASPGTDIAFSEARTEGYRAFANKIWNAARFLFMQRERVLGERSSRPAFTSLDFSRIDRSEAVRLPHPNNPTPGQTGTALEDRWIFSRLFATANAVNTALAIYRFDNAAHAIYQFFWGDLCDWYLEITKIRMDAAVSEQDRLPLFFLFSEVFESSLRMLSPFMPFITEEIWHAFYDGHPPARSIALMPYPVSAQKNLDDAAEAEMAQLQSLIVAVRAARKDAGVPERESAPILLRTADASVFHANLATIQRMARVSTLEVVEKLPEALAHRATPAFDVAVVYEKPVDAKAERERLTKELAKMEKEKRTGNGQLANEAFLDKAPTAVVEGLRRRNAELTTLIQRTRAALDGLPPD